MFKALQLVGRHGNTAAELLAAVAVPLLLACLAVPPLAAAQEEPFWHFGVVSGAAVAIVFPAVPGVPASAYSVQRSDTAGFESVAPVSSGLPVLNAATSTYTALDVQASWTRTSDAGGYVRPFYRVAIGAPSRMSPPLQPVDEAGNTFVTPAPLPSPADCGALSNPCFDLRSAIARAAPGSAVFATPGEYSGPNNTDLSFGGGDLRLEALCGRDVTAIDCGNAARAVSFDGRQTRASILAGFTIRNGSAPAGGCIHVSDSSPTIRGCRFWACRALTGNSHGGAVYIKSSLPGQQLLPGPLVQDSEFIENYAVQGAGIYVQDAGLTLERCTFNYGLALDTTGQGGAYRSLRAVVNVSDTLMVNGIVGFGGGGVLSELSMETWHNLTVANNSAGSFGGGANLFGSAVRISDSRIQQNDASLYGGGMLALYGDYRSLDTEYSGNRALLGGGGMTILSASVLLQRCTVQGNHARWGGGVDAGKQDGGPNVPTHFAFEDSMIAGNKADDYGAGIQLDNCDSATLTNVTFARNQAKTGGGFYCKSQSPASFRRCAFVGNKAQMGGAFFVDSPCSANISGTTFEGNAADDYGGALAMTDDTAVSLADCSFLSNGISACNEPVAVGGAVMVGVEPYRLSEQCAAQTVPATLQLTRTTFANNTASDRGGALAVQSGTVAMQAVRFEGNRAAPFPGRNHDGVGGGLAVERRYSRGAYTSVAVAAADSWFEGNHAAAAGGGIYFNAPGQEGRQGLQLQGCLLHGNTVAGGGAGGEASGLPVGGGAYLGSGGFRILRTTVSANEAHRGVGGGLFIAADLSAAEGDPLLQGLRVEGNAAERGAWAFWLRSRSPTAELACVDCTSPPGGGGSLEQSATEVVELRYLDASAALRRATPGQPVRPGVAVGLWDFYGQVASPLESGAKCEVAPPPGAAMGPSDRVEGATAYVGGNSAVANFTGLLLKGTINSTHTMSVACLLNATWRSKFAPAGGPLQALQLTVHLTRCSPGSEPKSNSSCVGCPASTYDLQGTECRPCPEGATCPGGSELLPLRGYWHNASDPSWLDRFYPCPDSGACSQDARPGATAAASGIASPDGECRRGHTGPLCAVCGQGFFKFSGICRECDTSGEMALAMLAILVTLFLVMVIAIFAFSWDFGTGPGLMTRVKIFLVHLQMLSLIRDYDLDWPSVTKDAMTWFELANAGLPAPMPDCFASRFDFYWLYKFQMAAPFVMVALCVAAYAASAYALRCIDPTGTRRTEPRGVPQWLLKLNIRCWKNGFWLVTLLYPRCAMTSLQLFSWAKINGIGYLKADYRIVVRDQSGALDPTYASYIPAGVLFLVVFALAVPAFWFLVLWRNRHSLKDPVVSAKYGFLYTGYSARWPYWETTEMVRKVLVALIPVFVPAQPLGSLQCTVGQVVIVVYMFCTMWARPFERTTDNVLQLCSLAVLWLLLLSGGVAKWANLDDAAERGLAAAQLVLASFVGAMVVAVVVCSSPYISRRIKLLRKRGSDRRADRGGGAGKPAPTSCDAMSLATIRVRAGGTVSEDREPPPASRAGLASSGEPAPLELGEPALELGPVRYEPAAREEPAPGTPGSDSGSPALRRPLMQLRGFAEAEDALAAPERWADQPGGPSYFSRTSAAF